jgi:hypothetical protein
MGGDGRRGGDGGDPADRRHATPRPARELGGWDGPGARGAVSALLGQGAVNALADPHPDPDADRHPIRHGGEPHADPDPHARDPILAAGLLRPGAEHVQLRGLRRQSGVGAGFHDKYDPTDINRLDADHDGIACET